MSSIMGKVFRERRRLGKCKAAHLDTAPGARPLGRFNLQTFGDETVDFWAGHAEAA
jgi:hypothetical protein